MGALHPLHFQDHPSLFARCVDEAVLSPRLFPVSGNETPLYAFRVGPVAVVYELGVLDVRADLKGQAVLVECSDILFIAFLEAE